MSAHGSAGSARHTERADGSRPAERRRTIGGVELYADAHQVLNGTDDAALERLAALDGPARAVLMADMCLLTRDAVWLRRPLDEKFAAQARRAAVAGPASRDGRRNLAGTHVAHRLALAASLGDCTLDRAQLAQAFQLLDDPVVARVAQHNMVRRRLAVRSAEELVTLIGGLAKLTADLDDAAREALQVLCGDLTRFDAEQIVAAAVTVTRSSPHPDTPRVPAGLAARRDPQRRDTVTAP